MIRGIKTKAIKSRHTNLYIAFGFPKKENLEEISSLHLSPVGLLIRVILTVNISKLQNSSQHWQHSDSLFPEIQVGGELSPKGAWEKGPFFHLLEYWSHDEKGREKAKNPHLLLESHNLGVLESHPSRAIAFPYWT